MADFAAIYISGDVPEPEWLSGYPGVTNVELTIPGKNQMKLTFLEMNLTINVMSDDELKVHLAGFANYVMSLHIKKQADATHSILERIASTKNVLGCVIEPRLDNDGFMGGLLTTIAHQGNGFIFARNSVFDMDGTLLIEPYDGGLE